jgi:hypothetical protein
MVGILSATIAFCVCKEIVIVLINLVHDQTVPYYSYQATKNPFLVGLFTVYQLMK